MPLDLDLARAAQLRVGGEPGGSATWDGTRPGGHHREGTLRFTDPAPAGATIELRITGLPEPVTATWNAP